MLVLAVLIFTVTLVFFYFSKEWRRPKISFGLYRNDTVVPTSDSEVRHLRKHKWMLYNVPPENTCMIQLRGCDVRVRKGLTFTPYADAVKCPAHCKFCSEELERPSEVEARANGRPTKLELIGSLQKKEGMYDSYFASLRAFFTDLRRSQFSVGLSLSGLEPTAEITWMHRMIELVKEFRDVIDERVVYTNGYGFAAAPEVLIPLFRSAGWNRIELSRQHYKERKNQKIMRFHAKSEIRFQRAYENVVRSLLGAGLHVKNSCILSQEGVCDLDDVEEYVMYARSLGIHHVVFRELSRFTEDDYVRNETSTWCAQNRVPVESLMVAAYERPSRWRLLHCTIGYYYYHEEYEFNGDVRVLLECSSYERQEELLALNASIVDKLVMHSNGDVTSHWYPDRDIVTRYPLEDKLSW